MFLYMHLRTDAKMCTFTYERMHEYNIIYVHVYVNITNEMLV